MKFIKEAVYSEKYKDREGNEKTKYTNVGALFQRDDGSMCAKIMGSWINFYDPKPRENNQGQSNQQSAPINDDFEDDIPF
jgi:hypothetical protein